MLTREEQLIYLYKHIFFPPNLPAGDEDIEDLHFSLDYLNSAVEEFSQLVPASEQRVWQTLLKSVSRWSTVYSGTVIDEKATVQTINKLKTDEWLLFIIIPQNTAVLLQKTEEAAIFECFEISAHNAAVMKAQTGLQRYFPALSVAIGPEYWEKPEFRTSIAHALHMLSNEQPDCSKAVTTKARSVVNEERDSASPGLVTQLLFSFLDTYGAGNERQAISKKIRDNVCWGTTPKPWRRSPVWLSIKVSIQLMLSTILNLDAEKQYKNFMLFLHVRLGRELLKSAVLGIHDMHLVRAKLAYRSQKLGASATTELRPYARSCVEDISEAISTEWSDIRAQEERSTVDMDATGEISKHLALRQSTEHLRRALERYRGGEAARARTFLPDWPSRGFFDSGMVPTIEIFEDATEGSDLYLMTDVEGWIQNDLDVWLSHCSGDEGDCEAIFQLAIEYYHRAKKLYEANVAWMSSMMLNLLHLWVALDTLCVRMYPLMGSFSPELPVGFLEPLLLLHASDMKRLRHIESHISRRHSPAGSYPLPSMFGPLTEGSFQVQFFESSRAMKKLLRDIQAQAKAEEAAKLQEHRNLSRTYDDHMEELDLLEHDHPNGRPRPRNCGKCVAEKELNEMSIDVFEKPMPSNKAEAKALCYELQSPQAVRHWRDMTMIILQDVGQPSASTQHARIDQLLRYQPLKQYYQGESGRVCLVSTTQSFRQTHFHNLKLPVEKDKVIVNHGLSWHLAFNGSRFTEEHPDRTPLREACTLQLPDGCYTPLQFALESWTHSQNEVIANQSMCSSLLTVHEYEAFATLRSGVATQWLLMLKNLRGSNLNLNSLEVYMLYCQTVWQAGPNPNGSVARNAHEWLHDMSFCQRLVDNLAYVHDTIKGNWTEINVMKILALLLLRMINVSPMFKEPQESGSDHVVASPAWDLLRAMRQTMKGWTTELRIRLRGADGQQADDENRTRRQLLEAALLCQSTFFLEEHALRRGFSAGDLALFVSMSIISHDHAPDLEDAKDTLRQSMFGVIKRNIITEAHVGQLAAQQSTGVSDGINEIWDNLTFTAGWNFVNSDSLRWVQNVTEHGERLCHFNLVTGRLTINAQSMQRLPDEYVKDPLYLRVFGNRILDVSTSSSRGMTYTALHHHHGYNIEFGMIKNKIVIRASLEGQDFEILSEKIWTFEVPAIIVNDTVQWLDLGTGKIEFRQLEKMWEPCSKNYILEFNEQQPELSWMHQGYTILLDINSDQQLYYANLFCFFEDLEYVHITLDHQNRLEVHLPRFGFKFFRTDDGTLESQEFSGFRIARDRSIGTLHGLQSKLILEGLHPEAGHLRRLCLIPFGNASIEPRDSHVRVHIEVGDQRRRTYHKYWVLEHSNCLRPSGHLLSHLYLAYLHAVTSFPEPDALTMLTGIEASLFLLRQDCTLVTTPHNGQIRAILSRISELSPVHCYYPERLRTMEQVRRNGNHSVSTQHPSYQLLVSRIIAYNEKAAFLFQNKDENQHSRWKYQGDLELLERAAHLWPYAYPIYPFNESAQRPAGLKYHSREALSGEQQSSAHCVMRLVKEWPAAFDVDTQLWRKLSALGRISGFSDNLQSPTLTSLLSMDIAEQWGALLDRCINAAKATDEFLLSFQFSTISYGQPRHSGVLQQLLAFAFSGALKALSPPIAREYRPVEGYQPDESKVAQIIAKHIKPFSHSAPNSDKRKIRYDADVQRETTLCRKTICNSFPHAEPTLPSADEVELINIDRVRDLVRAKWKIWHANHFLKYFVSQTEKCLKALRGPKLPSSPLESSVIIAPPLPARQNPLPSLVEAIEHSELRFDQPLSLLNTIEEEICTMDVTDGLSELRNQAVPDELRGVIATVRKLHPEVPEYLDSLDTSLDALIKKEAADKPRSPSFLPQAISVLVSSVQARNKSMVVSLETFGQAIASDEWSNSMLRMAGLWPRLNTCLLLQTLSLRSRARLPQSWFRAIVGFGVSVTELQKCLRLIRLLAEEKHGECAIEFLNPGHVGWNPVDHPDWLLLEIEQDLLVREIQARVAHAMISPASEGNVYYQIGMGEGKTKVIMNLVVCAVANREQLARVIVLRELEPEMLAEMSIRLGGLISRRVLNLPFSRSSSLTRARVSTVWKLFSGCLSDGGVVLTTPESLLALQQLGPDKLASEDTATAGQKLIDLQLWLDESARDCIDESDKALSVILEQCYTLGSSVKMDAHPERWTIVEQLYLVMSTHARQLARDFPEGVEYTPPVNGAFPTLRILHEEAGDELISRITLDVVKGVINGFSLYHYDDGFRQALQNFIQHRRVDKNDYDKVIAEFNGNQLLKLYIIRGQLAHRIVLFPLENRRHNVNFGLSLGRCLNATPYTALFCPSPTADFAQPDILVVTTIISYYYDGLTEQQLRQSIAALLEAPGRDDLWHQWAIEAGLPRKYNAVKNINLEDQRCLTAFKEHLLYCKPVLDFFLNMFVFPKEGVQYPFKLQKSAADILKRNGCLISTGFSGTNGLLLPDNVRQGNIPELSHTDADVMATLLSQENREYILAAENGKRLESDELLGLVTQQEPPISVLIDAGAQVITRSNMETARLWLAFAPDSKQAAVYFNEGNIAMVTSRDGDIEPFVSSRFRDSPQSCVVYMSQAQVRGVDMQFPIGFRAAVTLGPRLDRDTLVQAALRMRKLGRGQSICWLVPPDIDYQISKMSGSNGGPFSVADILGWTISQTCQSLVSNGALHVLRRMNYLHRMFVMDKFILEREEDGAVDRLLEGLREKDVFTVEEMYQPNFAGQSNPLPFDVSEEEKDDSELRELTLKWSQLAGIENLDAEIEVETEKEVSKEVEKIKEMDKPPAFEPHDPIASTELNAAIRTGILAAKHFIPAFSIFRDTSAANFMDEPEAWYDCLYATRDFVNTIKDRSSKKDTCLKPVNFILSFEFSPDLLLVVSQYEANEIIPLVKASAKAILHVYSPRVSRAMETYDELDFYRVTSTLRPYTPPPKVQALLNILAGQLYFSDQHHYAQMCDFLGVLKKGRKIRTYQNAPVCDSTKFVDKRTRVFKHWHDSPFEQNPLKFVQTVLSLRRKGQDFSRSTMAKICNGEEPNDDEFAGGD